MSNTITATQPLDFSLADLPARNPFKTLDHAGMCAFLDERHAACIRVAESTLDLAATINARGDYTAARSLIDEASLYLAEAARIRARRI